MVCKLGEEGCEILYKAEEALHFFGGCGYGPSDNTVCFSFVSFNAVFGNAVSKETDFCTEKFCFLWVAVQFVGHQCF